MYYGVVTVHTKPGKRFAGIDKLKELATWIKEKYGTPTQVLGNGTGPIYENHVVTQYDSLAQMEEVNRSLAQDEAFQKWFAEADELIEWWESTSQYFIVFD